MLLVSAISSSITYHNGEACWSCGLCGAVQPQTHYRYGTFDYVISSPTLRKTTEHRR